MPSWSAVSGRVFRMLTNNPGVWSEFGAGLPNTVVDVEYNLADDVLVAGTFGHGAWTIEDASDFLTVNGALQIFGVRTSSVRTTPFVW